MKKNEEMLIISSSGREAGRGGDHPPNLMRNLIGGHGLNSCLDGLSINRSSSQLRLD